MAVSNRVFAGKFVKGISAAIRWANRSAADGRALVRFARGVLAPLAAGFFFADFVFRLVLEGRDERLLDTLSG
jgi:hypothetical protein